MKRIIVIGGGPGGYVAAIKAAQMGAKVHIVEQNKFGGTCLNIGCIPTKALLQTSDFYQQAKGSRIAGVLIGEATLDWPTAQREKNLIIDRLVGGITGLLRANQVKIHNGTAKLINQNTVAIEGEDNLTADAIIIATGSEAVRLNFPGAELAQVIDSTQALALESVPKSMAIVGGGVIGVEFASLYHALGAKVTIIEMLDEILPSMDRQIANQMHQLLANQGVDVFTQAKLVSVQEGNDGNVLTAFETAGGTNLLESEKVLVAVGRKPKTENLGLDGLGINTVRGAIQVDDNFETSVNGIFAIGDCNTRVMLAHAASAQGEAAVEYIIKGTHHYNKNVIPACVYTKPEIAAVGLTEEQAKEQGLDYKCGVFPLSGNGKSMIEGDTSGFIKIIADAELGEVLGAHMIGPRVTDMIGELAVLMTMEGVVEDIIHTVHAHPTVSEAIAEAAMAVFGNPIHWPPKR